MRKSIKIGDIFEIPLANGKKAFGRYIFADKKKGPLIEVYDFFTNSSDKVDIKQVVSKQRRFPPVITGLFAVIRSGLWRVVGSVPVENFQYPKFVSTFWNDKTGEARIWFLWDGQKEIKLGPTLPKEYRNLEYLVGWDPSDIAHRIETGEYIFPYRDLIERNRFEPRK
jgi:hypothetical protein